MVFCSKPAVETIKKVQIVYKANSEYRRKSFWCFIVNFEHIHTFSSVSNIDFE